MLNWGMGHATRSAAIIKKLQHQDNEIVIASDSDSLSFLKSNFPDCKHIELPPYHIKYPDRWPFWISFLSQLPKINRAIVAEKKQIQKIIAAEHFDLIVSDNRFGCIHSKVKSILITHQINIQSRYLLSRKLVNFFNHKFIKAFDEIWIPDNHESTHSGVLSSGHIATTKKFIGIQSILPNSEKKREDPSIDYLIIISGPEPARSVFEKRILNNLSQNNLSITILGGKLNHDSKVSIPSNVEYIPFANHEKIAALIYKSKTIICRAGYSTLMDIAHMNYDGNVVLVATKGQTEQEYLALLHSSKPNHLAMSEKKFFTEFPNLKLAK